MDELVEVGENLDEELYDAATQLLDERAHIEGPSAEETARSWETFKTNHPEIFTSDTIT